MVVVSCAKDECDAPFFVGISSRSGVPIAGEIEAETSFGIVFNSRVNHNSTLENITIKIRIPKELEIKSISYDKDMPEAIRTAEGIEWKGELSQSKGERFTKSITDKKFNIWFRSKTNWKEWAHPIEAHVSTYQKGSGRCATSPDGHYSKKIVWSHEIFRNNRGWDVKPERNL